MAIHSRDAFVFRSRDMTSNHLPMTNRLRQTPTTATSSLPPISVESYEIQPVHGFQRPKQKETSSLELLRSRKNSRISLLEDAQEGVESSNHDSDQDKTRASDTTSSSKRQSITRLNGHASSSVYKPGSHRFKTHNTLYSARPVIVDQRSIQESKAYPRSHRREQVLTPLIDLDEIERLEPESKRRKLDLETDIEDDQPHPTRNTVDLQHSRTIEQPPSDSKKRKASFESIVPTISTSRKSDTANSYGSVFASLYLGQSGHKGRKRGKNRHSNHSENQGTATQCSNGSSTQHSPIQAQENGMKRQRISLGDSERPLINLTKGFDELEQRAQHVARTRAVRATAPKPIGDVISTAKGVLKESRSFAKTAVATSSKQITADQDVRLSKHFKRCEPVIDGNIQQTMNTSPAKTQIPANQAEIGNAPARNMPKLKDRMKATSSHEIRTHDAVNELEDDELAGGNLITSLRQPESRQDKPESRKTDNAAPQSMIRAASLQSEHRIKIQSFLSTHLQKSSDDMSLVWNDGIRDFTLQIGGKPMRAEGSSKIVCLIGSDRFLWYLADNDRTVCIASSRGDEADANMIVVEFTELQSRTECYETVDAAWPNRLVSKEISLGQVEAIAGELASATTAQDTTERVQRQETLPQRRSRLSERTSTINNRSSSPIDITESPRHTRHTKAERDINSAAIPVTDDIFPTRNSRSTRLSSRLLRPTTSPPIERWSQTHNIKPWSKPLTYPDQGAKRVTVEFRDLERLDEGEWLNDNLIAFAVRRIEERLPPEWSTKVHFFNTFFYTAMSEKNGAKCFNYDAVKKWTKNKDLLSTPYIVVPINRDAHWYVAIICNLPNLHRQVTIELEGDELQLGRSSPMLDTSPLVKNDVMDVGTAEAKLNVLSLSDSDSKKRKRDEINKVEDEIIDTAPSTPRRGGKRNNKQRIVPVRKFDAKAPAIVVFDSFGSTHPNEIAMLKNYVIAEAKEKRQMDVVKTDLQGVNAKDLPKQRNWCDCGVYLIAYLEAFARNPRMFIERVMSKEDMTQDFLDFDPSAKRSEIRNTLLALAEEQHIQHKANKRAEKLKQSDNANEKHDGSKTTPLIKSVDNKDVKPDTANSASHSSGRHLPLQQERTPHEATTSHHNAHKMIDIESKTNDGLPVVPETPPLSQSASAASPQTSTVKADQSHELEMVPPRPYVTDDSRSNWSFANIDRFEDSGRR